MRSAASISPFLLGSSNLYSHTKEADNDPTNSHDPGASSVETIREES